MACSGDSPGLIPLEEIAMNVVHSDGPKALALADYKLQSPHSGGSHHHRSPDYLNNQT